MNFSVHLDDQTATTLKRVAARQGRTRNAIVAEAVKRWLAESDRSTWPDELLDWQGDPRLPPFESHRPRGKTKARFP
jgi:predicted transcriptional regulator